ncbi:2670_t:CDS:2 [Diversispora eburnea]|uniref:2670_t:CDS:1 n=1 Tax=Diversispora eburnea TaxID=1213867 RepID=A0A9N9C515_9GLOM|nr:2670_t:CDS:2 [Diversispora eburnea]
MRIVVNHTCHQHIAIQTLKSRVPSAHSAFRQTNRFPSVTKHRPETARICRPRIASSAPSELWESCLIALVILFGAAAGSAVLLIAERIPKVRREVLQKIPVVGNYWVLEEE